MRKRKQRSLSCIWTDHRTHTESFQKIKQTHNDTQVAYLTIKGRRSRLTDGPLIQDLKEVVVLLSLGLSLSFLGFFLLMVLVEGVPAGTNCSYSCDFFLQLVLVGVLWVFL